MWSWKIVLHSKAYDNSIVFLSNQEYSDRVFACQMLEAYLTKLEIPDKYVVSEASVIYVTKTENKGG